MIATADRHVRDQKKLETTLILKIVLTLFNHSYIPPRSIMVQSHAGRGKLLTSNLPQLQNLIKVSRHCPGVSS